MVGLGALLVAEALLAVLSAPNTFDSQTYHLPRIEHWVAQGSLEPYPVIISRQVTYPPGAEYLLVQLRLLTGGDRCYALVAWAAGVLCLLAVTRIVVQLGGDRSAQLLAGAVAATAPPLVLEASSTQTDIVMAAWVVALATLALDGVTDPERRAPRPGAVLLAGVATGLVGLTKLTGLVVCAALLVWWLAARPVAGWSAASARLRARAVAGALASGVLIPVVAAVLVGPYLWGNVEEFGHPLGSEYNRRSIGLQRHDPAAVLVNGLRQAHSMLDTPLTPVGRAGARAVTALSSALGVEVSDPSITFDNTTFPAATWYPSEGKAAMPIQAMLVAVGVLVALVRPGPRAGLTQRILAGITVLAALAHVATIKWSPWGNRLTLYIVVLAAPLAGVWLARVRSAATERRGATRWGWVTWWRGERPWRRPLWAATAVLLVLGASAGGLSALYGWPRRLVGSQSVFGLDDWHSRFVLRPQWAGDYAAVGRAVRASGARRVGIVQGLDSWEYPWWLLLRGRELVAMQSQLPHRPPAGAADLDAVVCATPVRVCLRYVPTGWLVHQQGTLLYALPPASAGPSGPVVHATVT